jgi:AraC-like DNA-binding protein
MDTITKRTDPSFHVEKRGNVGLWTGRPFRFCTIHWGDHSPDYLFTGDDPDPVSFFQNRSLEMWVREDWNSRHVHSHRHEFFELALIHSGTARHVTRQGELLLGRGHVLVMTPSGIHGYEEISNLTKTNIYLQPEWLVDDLRMLWEERGLVRFLLADALFGNPLNDGVLELRLDEHEMALCEHELAALRAEALNPAPSLMLFNGGFLKLLHVISRACDRAGLCRETPLDVTWRAVAHIEERARQGQALDVRQLAGISGMSEGGFRRLFRNKTDLSPMEFYQRRRIAFAASRLADSRASVTEVAHELGFSDSAHFARVFRAHTGLSPRAYRKSHTEAPPAGG